MLKTNCRSESMIWCPIGIKIDIGLDTLQQILFSKKHAKIILG